MPYEYAVEEALCFGWIDSTVRKLDEERYAQKFTPRKDKSNWSATNKIRANDYNSGQVLMDHAKTSPLH